MLITFDTQIYDDPGIMATITRPIEPILDSLTATVSIFVANGHD